MTGNDGAGPVIDPHMHLWRYRPRALPWLDGDGPHPVLGDVTALRRDHLPGDYRRAVTGQHVVATVHVAAGHRGDPVAETRWLETLTGRAGIADRYVVDCPFGTPDTDRVLDRQAAFRRVTGVRQVLAGLPPGRTRDPGWRAGVARAGRLGLSVDLLLSPDRAAEAAELAGAFPDVVFVVQHAAGPAGRSAAGPATWRRAVALLAARPNVAVKISAIATHDPDPTPASYAAVVATVAGAFGPHRTMFASDHPVGALRARVADVYDAYRAATRGFSAAERAALFHDTAHRIYRVGGSGRAAPTITNSISAG